MPQDLDEAPRDEARREAESLPIPGYDLLSVEEILDRIPSIPRERTGELIEYEIRHKHRKTVLQALEDHLDVAPIPDYHRLSAREVVRRLKGMPREEVRKLRRHEHRHKARQTVLDAIDRRLEAD
jgi:hypothetical protein